MIPLFLCFFPPDTNFSCYYLSTEEMFVKTESGDERFLVITPTTLLEVDPIRGETITSHYKRYLVRYEDLTKGIDIFFFIIIN